jgi:REP element-mobilizing transposase RayT
LLTICACERRTVFDDARAVTPIVTQLQDIAVDRQFALVVYCIMPDHMHALLEGLSDHADFRQYVRLFKQRTSFDWKQAYGTQLWQRSYFDRVLRDDEDTISVARYILRNPVRAGLVREPLEYPFLGSGTMDVREILGSV